MRKSDITATQVWLLFGPLLSVLPKVYSAAPLLICVQPPNFRLVGNTGLLPLPDNPLLETAKDLHHGEIKRGGGDLY